MLVLTVLAAILFIGVGAAEIVLAVRLRKLIRGEVFMALAGLAGVIAGVLLSVWLLSGALVLTIILGAYALVSGILLLSWRGDYAALPGRGDHCSELVGSGERNETATKLIVSVCRPRRGSRAR